MLRRRRLEVRRCVELRLREARLVDRFLGDRFYVRRLARYGLRRLQRVGPWLQRRVCRTLRKMFDRRLGLRRGLGAVGIGRHLEVDRVGNIGGADVVHVPGLEIAAHRLRRLALQNFEVLTLGCFGLRLDKGFSFGQRRRSALFDVFDGGHGGALGRRLRLLRLCRGRIGSGRPWRVGPFHTVLASPRCYIRSAYRPLPKGLGGLARRY